MRHVVIVAVCVVATLTALLMVQSRSGLYQARMDVVVVPVNLSTGVNPFWGRDYSLIATAGLLARMVNQNSSEAQTVSNSVTLAGKGETNGYAVRLPNQGGQWAYNYDRPILDVQAVGRTPGEVRENVEEAMTTLDAALTQLQDAANVPTDRRMSLHFDPEMPEFDYSQGRSTRALAATMILGFGATIGAVLVADDPRTQHQLARFRAKLRSLFN